VYGKKGGKEEIMNAALLPDELIDRKPRFLGELGEGETGYIVFTELIVMSDRSCFPDLNTELRDEGRSKVEIRRKADGSFHIIVPSDTKYQPGKLTARKDQTRLAGRSAGRLTGDVVRVGGYPLYPAAGIGAVMVALNWVTQSVESVPAGRQPP
jgi:hypothetical protein